jgi:hypothetical protein
LKTRPSEPLLRPTLFGLSALMPSWSILSERVNARA